MLHAECCEKGVHPWVPRRSSAPGPMVGSAEHANEVIMLASPYSVGFACQGGQGTLVMHPNYRCHIWHNERNASEKDRATLHFSAEARALCP